MSSCIEFEIAIEQRLRDALSPSAGEALDTHLATCAACSAYLAAASQSQGILTHISRSSVEGADWQAAVTRFQRTLQSRRRRLVQGLVVLLVVAPFSAWAIPLEGHGRALLHSIVAGGMVLGLSAAKTFFASRSLARALESGSGEDVLELQRRYLRGRVSTMRRTRVVGLVAFLATLACAFVPGLVPAAHGALGFSVLALIVGAGWLRVHLRELPRARRELAELGGSETP
jgi:hypothetical protein